MDGSEFGVRLAVRDMATRCVGGPVIGNVDWGMEAALHPLPGALARPELIATLVLPGAGRRVLSLRLSPEGAAATLIDQTDGRKRVIPVRGLTLADGTDITLLPAIPGRA